MIYTKQTCPQYVLPGPRFIRLKLQSGFHGDGFSRSDLDEWNAVYINTRGS